MEVARRDVVFVIGAPGAGKGTLCKRLAQASGLEHLSVGDLLRQVTSSQASGVDTINEIRGYIRRAELLPSYLLFPILEPELLGDLASSEKSVRRFPMLLDGFPRDLQQCKQFEEVFGRPALVLFFDCPRALAEQRVVSRNAGRPGDNLEIFDKRYQEFENLNPPIIEYYNEQGNLIMVDTSEETSRSWEKLCRELQASTVWTALRTRM